MRTSGAGLGNMFGQECTFSYMYTCIGYKLPTFGEYMLIGGFLCALRAQGWGICLVNRQVPGGQFPPGQVPDRTTSPRTSNMAGKLSGGKLSRGKLSASRFSIRSSERMDAHSNKYWSRGGIQIKETRN